MAKTMIDISENLVMNVILWKSWRKKTILDKCDSFTFRETKVKWVNQSICVRDPDLEACVVLYSIATLDFVGKVAIHSHVIIDCV